MKGAMRWEEVGGRQEKREGRKEKGGSPTPSHSFTTTKPLLRINGGLVTMVTLSSPKGGRDTRVPEPSRNIIRNASLAIFARAPPPNHTQ